MGARQSSEAAAADADVFVDYYELLEVDQNEPVEGIRKSYRRLALRYHPDKNPGKEAEANKKFTKLQEAYEVLSDETERAWYDQNRDRLMQGTEEDAEEDVDAKFRFFRSGGAAPKASSLAPGVGVAHLLRFYSPSIAKDLSDTDSSFFGTYRRLFALIAEEDRVAAPYPGEVHENDFADPDRDDAYWYVGFGHPNTPYIATDGRRDVRSFYQFWMNFSSRKSFAWKDKFDVRDAQDRRVKRLMEKDNKRARDAARREYNEAIRSLAVFIRRRDPRYKAYQAAQSEATSAAATAEAEKRRKAEAAKRQEEKRKQAASFQAQSWQMANEPEDDWASDFTSGESYDSDDAHVSSADEDASASEGDEDEEAFDCVACNKRFQSRAAWENHERSKKHKKEVQRLKREMLAEDELLGDDLAEDTQGLSVDDAPVDVAPADAPKKDKKKKKQEKKMRAALEQQDGPPPRAAPKASPVDRMHAALVEKLPHLAALPQFPERPAGSFDVFGYGSLIFKPPPHAIGYTPGYIQGFARRFAQHSVDHRGTPERPGRVVTLVKSEDWKQLPDADEAPEGDIVWGISYTIDAAHADEVRAYLDHREKNGYTAMTAPILGIAADVEDTDSEQPEVLIPEALVYVGLPDNEAFVGAEPLDQLAERIYTCQGPSGRNDEYLLRLAEAVRLLTPHSEDHHLFTLEKKVLALRAADEARGEAPDAARAAADGAAPVPEAAEAAPSGKPKRRSKKGGGGGGPEKCNVCHAGFPSRSKLFAHVREAGHAQAAPQRKAKHK
ncbi:hypothetical protein GLX27_000032 [Malassezia furfur]|uniref:Glutathione-specific gamma-glutamylcyclotransferase n=1 Tax=Malassezia furfur TaxID=55194 RepID=A0ABY8EHU5_MALFU|nr:hypothetical protein CBS14141_002267 [Malassezia furfur]WFD45412.1 hypothetical protein GLX27_000032 [Malassezia furfur]